MTPAAKHKLALILMFVTPAMWSANYLVARAATDVVPPHALAFWRWFIAGGLMLLFCHKTLRAAWPAWRKEWPDFLMLGAFGMWICGAFVYIGAQTTTALNIGLIYAACPVLIALFSHWVFKEHLNAVQYGGILLCLVGVLYVILKGQLDNLIQVNFTIGDAWILIAACSWVAYSLLLRGRVSVLDPFARLTCITAGGLVVLLPFLLWETATIGSPPFSPKVVAFILIAAILPGFGAYQAYSFMQKQLGTARTSLVLYLGPPYAAFTAWIILGEVPQTFHYLGAVMVLLGIYLASRKTLPKEAS